MASEPLSLRRLLIRQSVVVAVIVLVLSIAISFLSSGPDAFTQMGWAVLLSAGIGAFTLWQGGRRVRQGFIDGTNPGFALVPVLRETWPKADWAALDDYAARLEALGFRKLGEFTPDKAVPAVRGVAVLLSDPKETMIVELQHFERLGPTPLLGDEHFEVRIAIGSVVGGRIRVMVSDRPVFPGFYVARCETGVYASYPGRPIFDLLDKHRRLVEFVTERTGKALDAGYTLPRYVMLEREKQAEVRARLEGMSPAAVIAEFDAFAANPKSSYAGDSARLKALPARDWRELDAAAMDGAATTAPKAASTPEDLALRQRMEGGASWFYWIAGLSLVNTVTGAIGSSWGFVIGLGFTQVEAGWALSLGSVGLFALLGWLARKPSIAAFWIGIVLFGLDTLIFLVAGDWVGVAFHGLALYFLWTGLKAAREMKKLAARSATGLEITA
jgi:hypothetical protein